MAGYMGDKSCMTVHHLDAMKPECMLYHVKKKDRVYFVPDAFNQAEKEGFVQCNHCIGELT